MSSSKDMICCNDGKVFGSLHLDANNYIEGLDIISNIVID